MKKLLFIFSTFILILIPITLSFYTSNIPILKLKGNDNQKVLLNERFNDKGVYAKTLWNKFNINVKTQGKVNNKKVGTYKIKYIYKNGIFSKSIIRIVKVIDKDSPVITLEGGEEILVCPGKEYQELGYNATDNYDGDLTKKVQILKSNELIKYKVKDSSKNLTVVERRIKYEDKEPPVITLKGNSTMSISINSNYKEPGYNALDNCDGDLTNDVNVSGNVDTTKVGNYNIIYTVKDKSGNETSVTRTVKVYNNTAQIRPGIFKSSMIYLTFDDGPSATITPGVLDILKETGVKATFFVTGKSDSLNYLIKRAYDEGHTIALHTYSHNYSQVYQSDEAYFNDLYLIRNKVNNIIGIDSNIIRFPGGGSNTVSKKYNIGIMSRLVNQVSQKGFRYFDWNVSSGDASTGGTKDDIYNNVIKGISPTKTNVVLMHDYENNYKTLNALKDIINTCKNAGYSFAAIDENTPQVTHTVNN